MIIYHFGALRYTSDYLLRVDRLQRFEFVETSRLDLLILIEYDIHIVIDLLQVYMNGDCAKSLSINECIIAQAIFIGFFLDRAGRPFLRVDHEA